MLRQVRRCTASSLWDVLPEALADGGGEADLLQMIDRTIVRAHHCAASEEGSSWPSPPHHRQGPGRSRGGFTSKLHIRGNARGLPIALHVTARQCAFPRGADLRFDHDHPA